MCFFVVYIAYTYNKRNKSQLCEPPSWLERSHASNVRFSSCTRLLDSLYNTHNIPYYIPPRDVCFLADVVFCPKPRHDRRVLKSLSVRILVSSLHLYTIIYVCIVGCTLSRGYKVYAVHIILYKVYAFCIPAFHRVYLYLLYEHV